MQPVIQPSTFNKSLLKSRPPKRHTSKNVKVSSEDLEIVYTLESLKKELDFSHNIFEHITDPILLDSVSYQILSLNMKYKYYLNLCKERKLVSEVF